MQRTRIIIIIVAVTLIALLYNLPKVVVDNEGDMGEEPIAEIAEPIHNFEIPEELESVVTNLKENFEKEEDPEKSGIFADSLANLFASLNRWDSAAMYREWIAIKQPSDINRLKAGEAFYNALGTTVDEKLVVEFSRKAQTYFERVLENEPGNLEVKNMLAMTFVASSNPMQGVALLQEIVKMDSRNEEAILNLGILSIQSGQWEKAIERFESLLKIDSINTRAHFYLAISSLNIGDNERAIKHFNIVKENDKDPEVQANVDAYLEELSN